jgi:hypothetical protein
MKQKVGHRFVLKWGNRQSATNASGDGSNRVIRTGFLDVGAVLVSIGARSSRPLSVHDFIVVSAGAVAREYFCKCVLQSLLRGCAVKLPPD